MRAVEVLDGDHGPGVALLGDLALHRGDQAGDGDRAAVGTLLVEQQLADAAVAGTGEHVLEAHQRMVGDVEPEHLPLVPEQGHLVPLLDLGHRDRHPEAGVLVVEAAEQGVLADRLVALGLDVLVDGLLVDRDQRPPPVAHVVEGAALDQRLDHPLVADQRRHLGHEVVEVGEPALLLPGLDDLVDDVGADVADRGEPEADVAADRGERRVGLVDVGRQHLDLHPPALVEVDRRLVLVVLHRRQQRGHVLGAGSWP